MFRLCSVLASFMVILIMATIASTLAIGCLWFTLRGDGRYLSEDGTTIYRFGACILICAAFALSTFIISSCSWSISGRWAGSLAALIYGYIVCGALLEDRTLDETEYMFTYRLSFTLLPILAAHVTGCLGECKYKRRTKINGVSEPIQQKMPISDSEE